MIVYKGDTAGWPPANDARRLSLTVLQAPVLPVCKRLLQHTLPPIRQTIHLHATEAMVGVAGMVSFPGMCGPPSISIAAIRREKHRITYMQSTDALKQQLDRFCQQVCLRRLGLGRHSLQRIHKTISACRHAGRHSVSALYRVRANGCKLSKPGKPVQRPPAGALPESVLQHPIAGINDIKYKTD